MRKVPQKVFFCALVVLTLNVCVIEPMTFDEFLKDEKVIEIIDKAAEKVYLMSGSPGTAGNKRITGLESNKYYMVYDWGESSLYNSSKTEPDEVTFVAANGTHTNQLTNIGKLTGREITGLTNDYLYTVKSADALIGNVTHNSTSKMITNGTVTIETNSPSSENIDFSGHTTFTTGTWDVVKVADNGNTTLETAFQTSKKINLDSIGTANDYVFYESALYEHAFYFLRVIVKAKKENLNITITPYTHVTEQLEGILTYDTASVNLPHADPFASTISIEAEWSGVLDSIVGWHYGSTLVTASETLTDTLITSVANINLANPGSWPFTFVGIKDGKQYSGIFTVTIQAP